VNDPVSRGGGAGSIDCLTLDGGHQRLDAEDVHHAGEIVGQHVQPHFGGDFVKKSANNGLLEA
jgi:hypothetical protein